MYKIIAASILSIMLLSLGGCYWPGYWHDRHHHGGYRQDQYRHDQYNRYEYQHPSYERSPYHDGWGYRRR